MRVKFWSSSVISMILLLKVNESKANSTSGVVFCYYNLASTSRSGEAIRFSVNDIPLDLCTHVIYSSIRPTSDGNITFSQPQGNVDGKSNSFEDFVALRESANAYKVKLMASLGGSEEDSKNFSIIVNNEALRRKIIDVLRSFVQSNNLDGIDLLWKYPTLYGGTSSDKVKYTTFIHDLKTSLGGQYLLSAAVGHTESVINTSYYVQEINQYVDYINLLSSGFNEGTENVTGVNAPLYAPSDNAEDAANNVNASVNAWIAKGASPSKLVLGLGVVGKTFELISLNNTGVGAPTLSAGAAGLTGVRGEMSYLEICTDQRNNSDQWNITEVDDSFVYANKKLLWVGYDNINTIFAKGKFAKNHGLAGISLWSLDLADFNGACGDKYLLLKSGISGYKNGQVNINNSKTKTSQESQKATPFTQSSSKTVINIITDVDDCDENDDNDITTRKISSTDINEIFDEKKNTLTVKVDDLSRDNATFILGPGPQISSLNNTIFDGFGPIRDTNALDDVKTGENTQTLDTRSVTVNVDDLIKINANETIILGPGPQISNLNGTIYDGFQPKSQTEKSDNTAKSDGDIQKVGNGNFINFKVHDLLNISPNETIILGPGPQVSTSNSTISDDFQFQSSTDDDADKKSKDTQEVKNPTSVTVNIEDLLKDSRDPSLITTPGPQVIPPKGTMIGDLELNKDKKSDNTAKSDGDIHKVGNGNFINFKVHRLLNISPNETIILGPGPQISTSNSTISEDFQFQSSTDDDADKKSKDTQEVKNPTSVTVNVEDLSKDIEDPTLISTPGPQVIPPKGTMIGDLELNKDKKSDNTAKSDGDIQKVGNGNYTNFKVHDLLNINPNETIILGPGPQISTSNTTISEDFQFQSSTDDDADKTSKDTQEVKNLTSVTVNVEDLLKDSGDPSLISTPGPQVIPPKGTMIGDLELNKDKKSDNTAKSDGDIQKVGNGNFINFKVHDLLNISPNETIILGTGPQVSSSNSTISDDFQSQSSTDDDADKKNKHTQEVKNPTSVTINIEDLLKDSGDPSLITTPGPQVIPPKGTMIGDLELNKDKKSDNTSKSDGDIQKVGNGNYINFKVHDLLNINPNETIILGPGPQISTSNTTISEDFQFQSSTEDDADKTSKDTQEVKNLTSVTVNVEDLSKDIEHPTLISTPGPQVIPPKGTMIGDLELNNDKKDEYLKLKEVSGETHEDNFFERVGIRIMRVLHFIP